MIRSSPPIWLEFSRRAMACQFDVMLHPNLPDDGPEHAVSALGLIDFLEQLLSVYIPTSDLSRLNHRARDIEVDVSLPTLDLLRIAQSTTVPVERSISQQQAYPMRGASPAAPERCRTKTRSAKHSNASAPNSC